MTTQKRNLLTLFFIILLTVSAFGTGYLVSNIVNPASADDGLTVYREAMEIIDREFIGEIPSQQVMAYAAIRGSMGQLDDPYTVFIEPIARDHEREVMTGNFGGIGAYLSRPEEGGPIVLEPMRNNPAEKAGILSGDELVAVDGTPITDEMETSEVVELIKGEKGTAVILSVIHPDESEPTDVEIIRNEILIPSVAWRVLENEPTIGYIQLTRFSGESADEMKTAVIELQDAGVEKIIIDLRGNGGGLVDAAVAIADHFVSDGTILHRKDRSENERNYNAHAETIAPDIPLVILVDGNTASASEILAGALHDYERATLIGASKTFGKGSVQLVYDLSDGSSVHVTSAKWFTPDYNPIDKVGLDPDILVEITVDGAENGRDEVLERAIAYLNEE
jgi:carboxyl-terminal processing protease